MKPSPNEQYDIILVQPKTPSPYASLIAPYGPLYLATKLLEHGYRVLLFDDRIDDRSVFFDLVKKHPPILVGFSIFTGPMIKHSLELAGRIRNINPEIPLVWGNVHCTILPRQTVQNPLVDVLVRGEGDYTLPELAKALKDGGDLKEVDGITFQEKDEVLSTPDRQFISDWDKDVSPAWDLVDLNRFIMNKDGFNKFYLLTSRGCPFKCSFCFNILVNKRKWRGWSVEKIRENVRFLKKYGVDYIVLSDIFLGNNSRLLQIAKMLKSENVHWSTESGVRIGQNIDDELCSTFRDCGCTHISFGSESGSQRILNKLNKEIDAEEIIITAKMTAKYGLGAKYNWMLGIPGEEEQDIIDTLDLIDNIDRINTNTTHFISLYSPYPGTKVYEEAVQAGWSPPQTLEEWSQFREQIKYPYIEHFTRLQTIIYDNFILSAANSPHRSWSRTRPLYSLGIKLLKPIAKYRWRNRFFKFPIETIITNLIFRVLNRFT